ncbi:fungal-specific transcription factor domain-containing protein [Microdochium trichocladiopsis]|uniref:Fungal-specific transcription factor domain-containing protein n=1 Tax=Microdochium trichocladiopsis TaxID=1682393 RepID=A0A9P9BJ33_9PEZI|nr:fungal-specific transcription factor domain-containing protein [Microdochium trichocladiopsis]KAH7024863.1 fungal-specific transcription factor domain-containing protein [Microdochium trichocladiopsis]
MAPQVARGCWTCKGRKVRCDRSLPHCKTCAKSNRECQGYGVRLSWPREHDPKRSLLGPAPLPSRLRLADVDDSSSSDDDNQSAGSRPRPPRAYYFVQAGSGAIEVYRDMLDSRQDLQSWHAYAQLVRPMMGSPHTLNWSTLNMGEAGKSLMQYFYNIAYTSIPTFSAYSTSVRGLLVRMAFSSDSLPAQALRHGMLALASVHRRDHTAVITGHERAALRALAASVADVHGNPAEAARHIAAVMLLSTLYFHGCWSTGNEWIAYLRGARELIEKCQFDAMVCDSDDISELMDWVYHHDVFSRYTSHHWRRAEGNPHRRLDQVPEYQIFNHPLQSARQGRNLLGSFHEVFDFMLDEPAALGSPESLDAAGCDAEMARLVRLQERLRDLRYVAPPPRQRPAERFLELGAEEAEAARQDDADTPAVFELYRLSALVALARVGESRFGQQTDVDSLLEQAVEVMKGLETCQRQFPLLVLGSQVVTDEHRRVVMDLLTRSVASETGRKMMCLQSSVKFSWVQMDLHADQNMVFELGVLMRTLCGNCLSVPSLA